MKICAFSDSHGLLPKIKKCELLFICGDIVPLKIQKDIPKSLIWFNKKFIPWCAEQPVDKVYLVAGNHDFFLEKQISIARSMLLGTNITLLYDEEVHYIDKSARRIWSIWGSPLCHKFGNWAFMYSDEYNKSQFEKIPSGIDILLTHDAAYEHNDQCLEFPNGERYIHRGNIPLKEVIEQRKPKYHFYGHLHSSEHKLSDFNGTQSACVSLVNEEYLKTYQPLYLDL
jgi:Icc-related predicted phosphoesterase